MFSNIENFLQELHNLQTKLLPTAQIKIVYKRINKVSLRIKTTTNLFIDVYVNTETNRYDFSLIKGNKRIFGFDNLGEWHYHPLNNPDTHINCKEPSLKHILKKISRISE